MNLDDREELTKNLVRYRTAALICFGIAMLLYAVVVTSHAGTGFTRSLASLGVAWWLVGCGLVPLTCYWAWRRAQIDRTE